MRYWLSRLYESLQKYTEKPYCFLVIKATLAPVAPDNFLRFRKDILEIKTNHDNWWWA